jgi:hypothetical protein
VPSSPCRRMKAICASENFHRFMVLPRPTARIIRAAELKFSSNHRSKNRGAGHGRSATMFKSQCAKERPPSGGPSEIRSGVLIRRPVRRPFASGGANLGRAAQGTAHSAVVA